MKKSVFWLAVTLLAIAGLAFRGPAEKTLGVNVRVVYLHGAWVWTALAAIAVAAVAGLAGLALRSERLNRWSRALGCTGLLFWITYLPLSLWARQTPWNGRFRVEPRWRLGVAFAAGGLVLQIGLALLEDAAWASAGNLLYAAALVLGLLNARQIMHPASPILQSGSWRIELFFFSLVLLCLLASVQVTRFWLASENPNLRRVERSNAQE